MEQFKMISCPKCELEIWYNTTNDHIDCTRCGFKIQVEPFMPDLHIEESQETANE